MPLPNDSPNNSHIATNYLASNISHLQLELERLDLLIRRETRRWFLAGQDPTDDYRGLYVSALETKELLEHNWGKSWGQTVTLPPEEEQSIKDAIAQNSKRIEVFVEQCVAQDEKLKLVEIANTFGLNRLELDLFLLAFAPEIDTRYERIFGYLQDNVNRRRPCIRLILDILGAPGIAQLDTKEYLSSSSPLIKYNLVQIENDPSSSNEQWINKTIRPDPTVTGWILGNYEPSAKLRHQVHLTTPIISAINETLLSPLLADLHSIFSSMSSSITGQVVVIGNDQNRQNAVADWLAAQSGAKLLTLTLPQTDDVALPQELIQLASRDALLTGAILYISGWERFVHQGEFTRDAAYQMLNNHPHLSVIGSTSAWQPHDLGPERPLFWIRCDGPSFRESQELWLHHLRDMIRGPMTSSTNNNGAEECFSLQDIESLASQFTLTSGQIRDAAYSARYNALQAGEKLVAAHLFRAARNYSNPRLSSLARKVEPRYEWNDIILPANQLTILKELVATVRQRPKVLHEWGLGKKLTASDGVTVLFAGPPGTGKTMAAEVIAKELWLDLYKIDLASVVSKYIGETEKNLERIFSEAANSNAILFFDEADAIFGKRSEVKDAHDRYANLEVSYLLQRMEAYDGITILATNLRANLDEAFARRLQFAVDFPFPDIADRIRIWETLFPNEAPTEVDLDLSILAERFELAGGNIRNILVASAYLAANENQPIGMSHLMHAAKRELQKMGRLVGDEDFELN